MKRIPESIRTYVLIRKTPSSSSLIMSQYSPGIEHGCVWIYMHRTFIYFFLLRSGGDSLFFLVRTLFILPLTFLYWRKSVLVSNLKYYKKIHLESVTSICSLRLWMRTGLLYVQYKEYFDMVLLSVLIPLRLLMSNAKGLWYDWIVICSSTLDRFTKQTPIIYYQSKMWDKPAVSLKGTARIYNIKLKYI